MKTIYTRSKHAAHYQGGGGHDLEQWSFLAERNERPADVPSDAEYHHGFLAQNGDQGWVYVRKAPMSDGACAWCQGGVQ